MYITEWRRALDTNVPKNVFGEASLPELRDEKKKNVRRLIVCPFAFRTIMPKYEYKWCAFFEQSLYLSLSVPIALAKKGIGVLELV